MDISHDVRVSYSPHLQGNSLDIKEAKSFQTEVAYRI